MQNEYSGQLYHGNSLWSYYYLVAIVQVSDGFLKTKLKQKLAFQLRKARGDVKRNFSYVPNILRWVPSFGR